MMESTNNKRKSDPHLIFIRKGGLSGAPDVEEANANTATPFTDRIPGAPLPQEEAEKPPIHHLCPEWYSNCSLKSIWVIGTVFIVLGCYAVVSLTLASAGSGWQDDDHDDTKVESPAVRELTHVNAASPSENPDTPVPVYMLTAPFSRPHLSSSPWTGPPKSTRTHPVLTSMFISANSSASTHAPVSIGRSPRPSSSGPPSFLSRDHPKGQTSKRKGANVEFPASPLNQTWHDIQATLTRSQLHWQDKWRYCETMVAGGSKSERLRRRSIAGAVPSVCNDRTASPTHPTSCHCDLDIACDFDSSGYTDTVRSILHRMVSCQRCKDGAMPLDARGGAIARNGSDSYLQSLWRLTHTGWENNAILNGSLAATSAPSSFAGAIFRPFQTPSLSDVSWPHGVSSEVRGLNCARSPPTTIPTNQQYCFTIHLQMYRPRSVQSNDTRNANAEQVVGGDEVTVEVRGVSLFLPDVRDELNGTYNVCVWFPASDAGLYEVSIRLHFVSCDSTVMCHHGHTSRMLHRHMGCSPYSLNVVADTVSTPNVLPLHSPHLTTAQLGRWVRKDDFCQLQYRYQRKLREQRPEQEDGRHHDLAQETPLFDDRCVSDHVLAQGYWVWVMYDEPMPAPVPVPVRYLKRRGSLLGSASLPPVLPRVKFAPALVSSSTSIALEAVQNRWIHMIGDSLTRNVATYFSDFLTSSLKLKRIRTCFLTTLHFLYNGSDPGGWRAAVRPDFRNRDPPTLGSACECVSNGGNMLREDFFPSLNFTLSVRYMWRWVQDLGPFNTLEWTQPILYRLSLKPAKRREANRVGRWRTPWMRPVLKSPLRSDVDAASRFRFGNRTDTNELGSALGPPLVRFGPDVVIYNNGLHAINSHLSIDTYRQQLTHIFNIMHTQAYLTLPPEPEPFTASAHSVAHTPPERLIPHHHPDVVQAHAEVHRLLQATLGHSRFRIVPYGELASVPPPSYSSCSSSSGFSPAAASAFSPAVFSFTDVNFATTHRMVAVVGASAVWWRNTATTAHLATNDDPLNSDSPGFDAGVAVGPPNYLGCLTSDNIQAVNSVAWNLLRLSVTDRPPRSKSDFSCPNVDDICARCNGTDAIRTSCDIPEKPEVTGPKFAFDVIDYHALTRGRAECALDHRHYGDSQNLCNVQATLVHVMLHKLCHIKP